MELKLSLIDFHTVEAFQSLNCHWTSYNAEVSTEQKGKTTKQVSLPDQVW
jgi:hypothetical protein